MPAQQLNMDSNNKVIIFERNNLLFLINFSVSNSIADYQFTIPEQGSYKVILSSDDKEFGGHNRIDTSLTYFSETDETGKTSLKVYLTNRTALVLKKVS